MGNAFPDLRPDHPLLGAPLPAPLFGLRDIPGHLTRPAPSGTLRERAKAASDTRLALLTDRLQRGDDHETIAAEEGISIKYVRRVANCLATGASPALADRPKTLRTVLNLMTLPNASTERIAQLLKVGEATITALLRDYRAGTLRPA